MVRWPIYFLSIFLFTATQAVILQPVQTQRKKNVSELSEAYSIIASNNETANDSYNNWLFTNNSDSAEKSPTYNKSRGSDWNYTDFNRTMSTTVSSNIRAKRAVAYNPFSLEQLFPRQPSPLDNSASQQNGLDSLIKRGLNAINDLSIFSASKNETEKEKTRSTTNNNIDLDSDSDSIGNVLKSQIQTIQLRLNSLAAEMSRFIQTITQSTTRLFLPQQGATNVLKSPTKSNSKNSNNQQNIFSRWFS